MTTEAHRREQRLDSATADYSCPQCDGHLHSARVLNQFQCPQCGTTVSEALSTTYQRVRSFYRAACGEGVSL